MTNSDLLRRAAAKIRDTAQAVSPTGRTPGPWVVYEGKRRDGTPYRGVGVGDDNTGVSIFEDRYCDRTDAEHIALWSPDVAELVAETLELASYDVWYPVHSDEPEPVYDRPDARHDPAVRLARRILGDDA